VIPTYLHSKFQHADAIDLYFVSNQPYVLRQETYIFKHAFLYSVFQIRSNLFKKDVCSIFLIILQQLTLFYTDG